MGIDLNNSMELFKTTRLTVREFEIWDDSFILELLNTEAWLQFIGDRKVHDEESARNYLRKVPFKSYEENGFGVNLVLHSAEKKPIGMCGFIQRNYLPNPDLGFAFLPDYWKMGYGFETAKRMLEWGFEHLDTNKIHAITLPENSASIALLTKLGFVYENNFISDDTQDELMLFTIAKS